MRITRKHVDALDVVASDFEFDDFIRAKLTFLDKAVTADHNEELPFGIVPMLSFGDARLGDVDGDLAAVQGVDQLRE